MRCLGAVGRKALRAEVVGLVPEPAMAVNDPRDDEHE
jgi:hypothetical protein